MQVEHAPKQYVRTPSTAPWGEPVDLCSPSHRAPLLHLCHHPADTCGCVSIFPSQRRPPHNTGYLPTGCPVHKSPHNTSHLLTPDPSCLHIPGPLFHQNPGQCVTTLHPPICAGLRWWCVHCDGRNNVPSLVHTSPVHARHSPVSQVHKCGSPPLCSLSVNSSCLISKCRFRSTWQ